MNTNPESRFDNDVMTYSTASQCFLYCRRMSFSLSNSCVVR